MEGLGKDKLICSPKTLWLEQPENSQITLIPPSKFWNIIDCFSKSTPPNSGTQREYMDGQPPVLELRDVPPPLRPAASQPFPSAPISMLPPCYPSSASSPPRSLAPPLSSSSPKVSAGSCSCSHCQTGLPAQPSDLLGSQRHRFSNGGSGGGDVSSATAATVNGCGSSIYFADSFTTANTWATYQAAASSASSLPNHTTVLSGHPGQLPSSSLPLVATSQPLSSLTQLPCCSGLLKPLHAPTCPQLAKQSCRQPSFSGCPASTTPTLAVTHGHPNLHHYHQSQCGGEGGTGSKQPPQHSHGVPHQHPNSYTHLHHGGLSTSPAQPCSHSLHHGVEHTVFLRGAHYCRDCLSKPASANKPWPNIPSPHAKSAPIPVPLCNGCGVPGTNPDGLLLLSSSLGKTGQKYGSPDVCTPESLPPVGVFWDIENCSVPTGRSAASVVQRLRARFFPGHREAEFICVCDISKENRDVIQELNNCQVTVAHINATAKNAADDKLRQSLRRFADTHTTPATIVLVSSDVNFASELSDLRHRHGFQVILVHKNQVSGALLQHAHLHVAFEEFLTDLPPRMPLKSQPGFNLLFVHNLPTHRDAKSVANRLRRLSDNCGGKVLGLSSGTAVLRFSSAEAAERACKRMENEDVFGCRIRVSFSPDAPDEDEEEVADARPGGDEDVGDCDSGGGAYRHLRFPAMVPSSSTSSLCSTLFLPVENPRSPRRLRRGSASTQGLRHIVPERPYSPRKAPVPAATTQPSQGPGVAELKPRMGFLSDKGRSSSPSPHTNGDMTLPQLPPQQRPGLGGDTTYRGRRRDSPARRSATSSPVDHFQISTPSAFSKLSLQRSFSPLAVLPHDSWSSRSGSPCLSNRSSPLSGTRSPCPDTSGPPSSFSTSCIPFSEGADIQVSNLDYRMSRKELLQILQEAFARHGKVRSVELSPHTDYQLKASVQMCSLQQAISAIGALHRYKVGAKRIQVSLSTGANNKSLTTLSSEIVSILQDAPASCLPLFKFVEIYERRFGHKLAVGELYRLPEVVSIRDQGGGSGAGGGGPATPVGRLVCLLPQAQALAQAQARQSPLNSVGGGGSSTSGSPVVFEELEYHEPVCKMHYTDTNFSEADYDPDSYRIPFVVMSVKTLAAQVHCLLQSHDGTVPLLSFPDCFAAAFEPMVLGEEGELENSVPLEHLLTCIPGVTVVTAQNGFKVIKWVYNRPPPPNADPWLPRCKSPVGNPQLIQFSRDLVDLLRGQPSSIMPLSRFIPAYHYHFAKQCRVSDYGFSKLLELLEAVPHVLQILGLGTKRLLTLTHRSQVKRFTQDLLKLLKFQASKQVVIRDFMQAYHWCFSRDWHVVDYGMSDLLDLLAEIPDTTITISQQDGETVISVPKRERTSEELERTRQFAKEVVDLLRHQPHCRMAFSRFIPTYHHHFGRQCKLSHYGFTKLLDLFEAIPDVLMVLECGEEKVLCLTEVEQVKALAAQLVKLLRAQKECRLPATQLLAEYSKTFGYGLRLSDYDANSLPELLTKLCHVVKMVDGKDGREVQLINRKSLRLLTSQLLALLMGPTPRGPGSRQAQAKATRGQQQEHKEDEEMAWPTVERLEQLYKEAHGTPLRPCEYGFMSLSELLKSLPFLVELYQAKETTDTSAAMPGEAVGGKGSKERVRLTRLYRFARDVRSLLHAYHFHQVFLSEFPQAFAKHTGRSLHSRAYGYATLDELLGAIPQVVWIKGHGHKKIVVLKNEMKVLTSPSHELESDGRSVDSQSPSSVTSGADAELLCLESGPGSSSASPVDLLCGPVPSCLPSPQLHPDLPAPQPADLLRLGQMSHGHTETEHDKLVEPSEPTSATQEACADAMPTQNARVQGRAPGDDTQRQGDDVSCNPPPALTAEASPSPTLGSTGPSTPVAESPSKRTNRSKVKLAAKFSFTPAPTP